MHPHFMMIVRNEQIICINFVKNSAVRVLKPSTRFIKYMAMNPWVIHRLRSGLSDLKVEVHPVESNPPFGSSVIPKTPENVEWVWVLINRNHLLIVQVIEEDLGIPKIVISEIISQDLGMSHVVKFGSWLLTDKSKNYRMET